jgi:T-complex protein 1 subunit gamma
MVISNYNNQTNYSEITDIVLSLLKTTLGPRSMLKMILDNQGRVIITNDGNCILREIDIKNPIAKSLIELSNTQDGEIGDGTTTVVIIASELLKTAKVLLQKQFNPSEIISSYLKILEESVTFVKNKISIISHSDDTENLQRIILTSIGTKLVGRFSRLICELSLKAAQAQKNFFSTKTNNHFKIEKIPAFDIEKSKIIPGVVILKDVSHPKMRRKILKPKILLLDCDIEYKKGETRSSFEISKGDQWKDLIKAEEDYEIYFCNIIKKFKPDLIFTEKNVSDIALHYLYRSNISVIRRIRKSDNDKLSKLIGTNIVSSIEKIQADDIGLAKSFSIKKNGDEYYSYIIGFDNSSFKTILLFAPSKDILDEMERNLHDGISVAKVIICSPRFIPGGGATELAVSKHLKEKSIDFKNNNFYIYKALAESLEIIPRILIENCGVKVIQRMVKLKNFHEKNFFCIGIEGRSGNIIDNRKVGIFEASEIKIHAYKIAFENASMLLKIDRIIKGVSLK